MCQLVADACLNISMLGSMFQVAPAKGRRAGACNASSMAAVRATSKVSGPSVRLAKDNHARSPALMPVSMYDGHRFELTYAPPSQVAPRSRRVEATPVQ